MIEREGAKRYINPLHKGLSRATGQSVALRQCHAGSVDLHDARRSLPTTQSRRSAPVIYKTVTGTRLTGWHLMNAPIRTDFLHGLCYTSPISHTAAAVLPSLAVLPLDSHTGKEGLFTCTPASRRTPKKKRVHTRQCVPFNHRSTSGGLYSILYNDKIFFVNAFLIVFCPVYWTERMFFSYFSLFFAIFV